MSSPLLKKKTTKITTAKQPLGKKKGRKTTGTYQKKNILHPKTKKPQQGGRRGTITIKSKSIPLGGQPTNRKTIISQKFSHRTESSEPHIRLPVWRAGLARSPQSIWL